jgi:hypothetical protein
MWLISALYVTDEKKRHCEMSLFFDLNPQFALENLLRIETASSQGVLLIYLNSP